MAEAVAKRSKKDIMQDLAASKTEKKGLGQYILLLMLIVYTLFCALPVILVFVAAFTDEVSITQNGFKFIPEKWSLAGFNAVMKIVTP